MIHTPYGIVEDVSTLNLDEMMATDTSNIRWSHQLVLVFVTFPYAISNSNSTAICNFQLTKFHGSGSRYGYKSSRSFEKSGLKY